MAQNTLLSISSTSNLQYMISSSLIPKKETVISQKDLKTKKELLFKQEKEKI